MGRKNATAAGAMIFLCLAGALAASCGPNKNSCNYRCQRDEKCMKALEADGIAPYGMTRNDAGLCNGICSSLNTMAREHNKQMKELGVPASEAPFLHPCFPVVKP